MLSAKFISRIPGSLVAVCGEGVGLLSKEPKGI